MTFQLERRVALYSSDKGDHVAWRKVRGQPDGKPLSWPTHREAEAFADLLLGRTSPKDVRVVEVTEVANA